MLPYIQIQNFKGGVGKTTTAVNIAHGLSRFGLRVLLLDLDHQGNASIGLGIDRREKVHTFYDLVKYTIEQEEDFSLVLPELLREVRPNLWLLPSSTQTASASTILERTPLGRESQLKNLFTGLIGFDVVLLDCPADLSTLAINAFMLSTDIIIPVQLEAWAFEGAKELLKTLSKFKQLVGYNPNLIGVLPTMVHRRRVISQEVTESLRQLFQDRVLPEIRTCSQIPQAQANGKTIFEYAPNSTGAQDYAHLAAWLKDYLTTRSAKQATS